MAIADHDTVNGLDEAVQTARKEGVCLIPAIELSLAYPNGIFHLLGYGIQYENSGFRDKLIWLKLIREERIIRIVDQLNLAGIELTHGDVQNELNGDAPGKPHIARALVKKGYAPDVDTALQTYLNRGMPGYVVKKKSSLKRHLNSLRVLEAFRYWPILNLLTVKVPKNMISLFKSI